MGVWFVVPSRPETIRGGVVGRIVFPFILVGMSVGCRAFRDNDGSGLGIMGGHDGSEWCVSLAFAVFAAIWRYTSRSIPLASISICNLVHRFLAQRASGLFLFAGPLTVSFFS